MKYIHSIFAPHNVLISAASLLLFATAASPVCAQSKAPAAVAAPTNRLLTYTPKAGESLDRVIKQTMADSPLKIEVLRKAFVDLNGHAFIAGNPSRLRANVALQVPDSQRLTQIVLSPQQSTTVATAPVVETENGSGSTVGVTEGRRHWIRYP